jgi:hypothetical protein
VTAAVFLGEVVGDLDTAAVTADHALHTLGKGRGDGGEEGGGVYSETWRTNPNGGGISIKLALDQDQHDVLQFEYTPALQMALGQVEVSSVGMTEKPKSVNLLLPASMSTAAPSTLLLISLLASPKFAQ